MPQHQIDITQHSRKPVGELFGYLANHENLSSLFMAPVKRIKDGEGSPNGVGSIRRIGPPLLGVQETVTALKDDHFIEYRISKMGGPVKNHRGRLVFSETPEGSEVSWHIEFDSRVPVLGGVLRTALEKIISRGLSSLA